MPTDEPAFAGLMKQGYPSDFLTFAAHFLPFEISSDVNLIKISRKLVEEQKKSGFHRSHRIITRVPKTLVNKRKMDTPKNVHFALNERLELAASTTPTGQVADFRLLLTVSRGIRANF